jgi:PTS system nitrogen regulatory IIA component
MADEPLMGVREIAEYLNVHISSIYMWSQKGQMPAIKMGSMWRYRRSEIDEWLNERRSPRVEQGITSEETSYTADQEVI